MIRHRHPVLTGLALAIVVGLIVVPSATATDFRDLRSADAQDAAANVRQNSVQFRDLRSPDAQDAAAAVTSGVTRAAVPAVVPASASDGFDWADAGIGAAGTLAVLLAALGGARAATHRRTRDEPAGPSALAH